MTGVVREGSDHIVTLDTRIYSLEAIKRTAYKFANRSSVLLSAKDEVSLTVIFNFVGKENSCPDEVIADFCNELLDQDLRDLVKRETAPIRNLILAHALSRSSLIQ